MQICSKRVNLCNYDSFNTYFYRLASLFNDSEIIKEWEFCIRKKNIWKINIYLTALHYGANFFIALRSQK